MNTFFLKRVDLESILFWNTNLKLKNPVKLLENKTKVRIIIPTYNRYNVLYNLLKDLENQTFSDFCVTIIDQSENFKQRFL